MKKTTMKISYDNLWKIELLRKIYKLKSKDEVIRTILSRVSKNALKCKLGAMKG